MSSTTRLVLLLLAGLALLGLLGWLIVILQPLLVALTISGLMAYLLNPFVVRLAGWLKGRRPLAAVIVYLLILLLLFGLFGIVGATAVEQWPHWQQELLDALTIIQGWWVRPFFVFGFELHPETIWETMQQSFSNTLPSITSGANGLFSGLTENLLWTLVVFVSFYYLLKDGHRLQPELLKRIPDPYRETAQQLLTELDTIWSVFLRVQLLIFAVLGVLIVSSTFLIIWLFRQGWLPLSPIGLALLLVGVYIAIQQVDNLWLRPQLMGHALKLHPGIIFVGLITGLALGGLFGAILIIPILASIKVLASFVYDQFVPSPSVADSHPSVTAHPPEHE